MHTHATEPSTIDPTTRQVLIFDFDGTLADTKPCIVETATQVLLEFGLSPEELGDVGRLVGPPFPQGYMDIYGLSQRDAEWVTARYREIYDKRGAEAWPPFPGIADLLDELHQAGKVLGVASSKMNYLLERGLTDSKLKPYFDLYQGKVSDKQTGKADTIAFVMEHLGATEQNTLMIGDRHYDVEDAAKNGIPCVGVTYGDTGDRAELETAGACAVAESVEELGRILLGN